MTLATRCTSCGTVFRVVQDQLKVSDGWVRCGRCNEVFNALEGLLELDRDGTPSSFDPAGDAASSIDPTGVAASTAEEPSDPDLVDRIDAELFGFRGTDDDAEAAPPPKPPPSADAWDGIDQPLVGTAPHAEAVTREPLDEPLFAGVNSADPLVPSTPLEGPDLAHPPGFVRDAERSARWKRSPGRMALFAAAFGLLALLGLQALHHFRDVVAARWPDTRTALSLWCSAVGCRLDAPRRIQDVSVESATLTRAGEGDAFRLSVTLRNRGTWVLAMPSVDLSLTDSNGQLVARRALAPGDFRAAAALLQPGAESALQLLLSTGTPRVSGYTVEIFYP